MYKRQELQEYIQRRIDILNVEEVLDAVREVYEKVKVPTLLVHSAAWALTYGCLLYTSRCV